MPSLPLKLIPLFLISTVVSTAAYPETTAPPTFSSRYVTEFENGDAHGALNQPAGMDVDPNGRIYVADTINSRVVVFNHLGQIEKVFGQYGQGSGQLDTPMALAVDPRKKRVYVADSSNHRVEVFNFEGEFVASIRLDPAPEAGEKNIRPIGIAVSGEGNVYISDADNNLIRAYSPAGEFLFKFGGFGNGDGQFAVPVGLAFDRENRLYAVDMNNSRFQVFDHRGKFLFKTGTAGDTKGSFGRPKDIAVDDKGRIFVSDAANVVIQVFDKTGEFLGLIGADKDRESQFASPFGVAVLKNHFYATDRWRNSVRVYEISS